MYFVRTDGSPVIGMGHIMRCIAIANEIKVLGNNVTFILSNRFATHKLDKYQFDYVVLPESSDIKDEISEYQAIFSSKERNTVLVDTYRADDDYLNQLSLYADVYYIDGLLRCNAKIAGLICFNPSLNVKKYEDDYKGTNTVLLLGSKYVPLRSEFKTRKNHVSMLKKQVLLTTGSTDNFDITESFCAAWNKNEMWMKADLHVIVGDMFKNTNWTNSVPNVQFHSNVRNMSELMCIIDIAVCQAGTTVFELLSQGIPTISFAVNDIQKTFSGLDPIILWKGCVQEDGQISCSVVADMISTVMELLNNPDEVDKMKQASIQYFDGNGAIRIAKAMCENSH